MKKLMFCFLCFVCCSLSYGQVMTEIGNNNQEIKDALKIFKPESKPDNGCDYLTLCEKYGSADDASACYEKAIAGTSCEIDMEDFIVIIQEAKKRPVDTGTISTDVMELMKNFLFKLKGVIHKDIKGNKVLSIQDKSTGKSIYSTTLVFSANKTYSRTVNKKSNYNKLRFYKSNTMLTRKAMATLAAIIFDQLTITLKMQ